MKTDGAPNLAEKRDFWRQLIASGGYTTAQRKRPLLAERIPALATLRYHLGTNWQVLLGAISVWRNKFDRARWAETCYQMLRSAEHSGGKLHISGLENISTSNEPVVVISNHMSTLETYILATLILPFADMAFVLKQELLTYPIFGALLRGTEPIAVTRKDARKDLDIVMTKGKEYLAAGRSIVIFPQSTRSAVFDGRAFNSLGIKLAARSGVQVVPLALKTDFLSNGKVVKDFGTVDPSKSVHLEFGPRLTISGKGKDEHETVKRFITERLQKWGAKTADYPAAHGQNDE